ncbi:DUF1223 domain-containing protein [Ancylobacter mangrovi]|uniref:DUF1223 domain-containing protein n=1 Tax=Ancylobacter mangrovi TaxID=2972472 RepID=UPI002163F2C4|nr:DUF1223 domain-containing protein [Ancylobacter mangrovi]MCS0503620.1 DUF1223 domain-containing protein [Ancylobacter mangrovi]
MKGVAIAAMLAALGGLVAPASRLAAEEAVPPARQPVVELFTSQGCSSCPPANATLIALADRPGVLALSFSVTYWDYLGWKDAFGRPEYTERQVTYEPKLGQSGPFTPQMVVDGQASAIGYDRRQMEALIAASPRKSGPALTLRPGRVEIGAARPGRGAADVWLVRYDPRLVEVPVRRGENSGRTLPHSHVVHGLARLGGWNGAARAFKVSPAPDGLRTAVLVQESAGGPILAAATD